MSRWKSPSVFFFQAEDGIRDTSVTGVQTCALPISHLLQGRRWAAEMTRNPRGAQETIDRREALRRAALLLGGALAAPTVAGVLAGCQAARVPDGAWAPRALSRAQVELVAAMAEHILPA